MKIFPNSGIPVTAQPADIDAREITLTLQHGRHISRRVEMTISWVTMTMSPDEARDFANMILGATGPAEPADPPPETKPVPGSLAYAHARIDALQREVAYQLASPGGMSHSHRMAIFKKADAHEATRLGLTP